MMLPPLGQETWGERLARARGRANLKYRDAATLISQVMPISYGMLIRLEHLSDEPTDARRRLAAFLAVMAYGFDPEDFGLSADDVPEGIDRDRLADLLDRNSHWSAVLAATA